jgi:uncharacterized membrane protein
LSPSINDAFTAMTCIDRLSDGLRTLMQREGDQRVERDADETIRFVHAPEPFSRYLSKAFDPIQNAASNSPMVLARLLQALERLHVCACCSKQRELIEARIELLQDLLKPVSSEAAWSKD